MKTAKDILQDLYCNCTEPKQENCEVQLSPRGEEQIKHNLYQCVVCVVVVGAVRRADCALLS